MYKTHKEIAFYKQGAKEKTLAEKWKKRKIKNEFFRRKGSLKILSFFAILNDIVKFKIVLDWQRTVNLCKRIF